MLMALIIIQNWYIENKIDLYGLKPRLELSLSLGRFIAVFQSEVFAIMACTHENLRRRYVKVVLQRYLSLAALNQRKWVTLIWVREHSAVEGNEMVDNPGPEPVLGIFPSDANTIIANGGSRTSGPTPY